MKNVTLPKVLMPYHCNELVRLGKDNDGGYLVNSLDVTNTTKLVSFGIGEDVSFEKDFVTQNEWCDVFAYDETVGSIHDDFFVGRRRLSRENIHSSNIEDILNEYGEGIFLKCDIDGAEYKILHELITHSNKLTGLAIEFHDVSRYGNFNELTNFIAKFELRLCHVHINNYAYIVRQDGTFVPDVLELSFSSSRSNTTLRRNIPLPHPLDMPNNPNDDEFRISF